MSKSSFTVVSPSVSLKRTNDAFAKHILSKREHKVFLIDLLNAVIFDKGSHPEDEKIIDVTLEDRVFTPSHHDEKPGILDIRAKTNKRIYSIEIQQYREADIGARCCYYALNVLHDQITKGVPYHKLTPVIIITFLTENHLSTSNYHSCYHYNEDDEHSRLTNLSTLHFIEFKKCRVNEKSKLSRLEQWVKYLSATAPAGEEIIPEEEMFKELSRIEKVYSKDKEEMLRYEAAERAEMDFVSAISSAELRGKEIGKAEGRAEGLTEGIAKGRTEGKAEGRVEGKKIQALETAKTLLEMGLSIQQIIKATGLSESEILQLKK